MSEKSTAASQIEQQLVAEAFEGSSAAFGKLVSMYQGPVYGMCMRYLKGEDARDAAQEVFLKAFVHRSQFSADRAVLPWLLTIARNLCIDMLRKRRPEQLTESQPEAVSREPSAEDRLVTRQSLELVSAQLDKLPEGQREAIVLHHVDGLAYREVAAVLDVPQGTVMTWLHRGRNAIEAALNRSKQAG